MFGRLRELVNKATLNKEHDKSIKELVGDLYVVKSQSLIVHEIPNYVYYVFTTPLTTWPPSF